MPISNNSTLYMPGVPHRAVTTLLLIENSHSVSLIWQDLQDHYLLNLDNKLAEANTTTLGSTFVLESRPLDGRATTPRQYDNIQAGLRDVRFDGDFNNTFNNTLTADRVASAIDFLALNRAQGPLTACHLVIVAVSPPTEETNVFNQSSNTHSAWYHLAIKMKQADIQYHLVNPTQNMGPLTTLFEDTLRLQNYAEEAPAFPLDPTKLYLRLSVKPSNQYYSESASYANTPQRRGTPPQRNQTYPLDPYAAKAITEPSAPESLSETPPSLVSQLQQVHGLTKKKVYGAKPTRQPFFRDERVREKYRRAPAPLMVPLVPPTTSQIGPMASVGGGRTMAMARAERMLRVGQGSPTELHSRKPKHGWPRRGSHLSSPEGDGLSPPTTVPAYSEASSINSYFPPTLSTPGSPISVDETFSGPTGTSTMVPVAVTDAGGMMSDPLWPQHHYTTASPSHAHTEFASPFMQQLMPLYNPLVQSPGSDGRHLAGMNQPIGMDPSTGMGNYTPMMMHPELSQDRLNNAHPHTRIGGEVTTQGESTATSRPSRHSRGSPEDEEPFTFNKEYIAATAALFNEEVLPAYPDFPEIGRSLQVTPPPVSSTTTTTAMGQARQGNGMYQNAISRHGYYFTSEHDPSPPPSPSYQTGELYVARMRQDLGHLRHQAYATEHLSYGGASSFAPGGSSSLTGWAG